MRKKAKKLKKILYYPKKNYRSAVQILKLLAEKELLTTQAIAEKVKTSNNHHGTKIQLEYLASLGYCEDYGIVSNQNHVCEHCKQTDRYLVKREYLDSEIKRLEKNRKLRDENQNKIDFDPKNYFNCREGYVLGRLVFLYCKSCGNHVDSHMDEEYRIHQDRLWTLTENGRCIFLVLFNGSKLYNFIKKHANNKVFELANVLIQSQEKHIVNRLIKKLRDEMPETPHLFKIANNWHDETLNEIMNTKYTDKLHIPIIEYQKKHYWEYEGKRILELRNNRFR